MRILPVNEYNEKYGKLSSYQSLIHFQVRYTMVGSHNGQQV